MRMTFRCLLAGLGFLPMLLAAPVLAQGQLAARIEEGPQRIGDLLRTFVSNNVASYTAETDRMAERLAGTVCEIGTDGLPPLALPEPSVLDLSAFIPPRASDVLRSDEHIDAGSVLVTYGHDRQFLRQIAADQETAEITDLPHGLPVRVTAMAFRVRDGECTRSSTRTTSAGARETLRQKRRVSIRFGQRSVDITDRLGRGLNVGGGYTFDARRNHLVPGSAGAFPFPTVSGKGARFDTVVCDGGNGSVLVNDDEDLRVGYAQGSPAQQIEVLGLAGLQLGTAAQRSERHMITGPGALDDRLELDLIARLVGADREFLARVNRPEAVRIDLRRGPLGLVDGRQTIVLTGTGEAGAAEVAIAPAGSLAGSLVDVLEPTLSRARLVIPERRPFADDAFTAELLVQGPLPADSGLKVKWRARTGGRIYQQGDLDAQAGGTPLAIPVSAPPMADVIRSQGLAVTLEVEIRRGTDILFEAAEDVLFRPPPVVGVDLVGRREGVAGEFGPGPHDLFRIVGALGTEIRLDVRFRDGSSRSFAPASAPAFGIQQSQGGGLLMAKGLQSAAIVRPRLLEEQLSAALRPFLRASAAETTNLSPVPGTPIVQGEASVFTLNDALLVIDNLGANGFIWRLLIEGEAQMDRYLARYVTSDGDFDEIFGRDGTGWVASRQFGASTAIRHVAIVDGDGREIARINQNQLGAIAPRVSLEIPEIYRQGVSHPVTASISGISGLAPFDLACQWSLESGFGSIAFGSTRLTPIGDGFATCTNAVEMDVNEATLGQFPTLGVRLVRAVGEGQ